MLLFCYSVISIKSFLIWSYCIHVTYMNSTLCSRNAFTPHWRDETAWTANLRGAPTSDVKGWVAAERSQNGAMETKARSDYTMADHHSIQGPACTDYTLKHRQCTVGLATYVRYHVTPVKCWRDEVCGLSHGLSSAVAGQPSDREGRQFGRQDVWADSETFQIRTPGHSDDSWGCLGDKYRSNKKQPLIE